MYDRFSIAVVAIVVTMLLAAFIVVVGLMEPNPGTAPPVAQPAVVDTVEAGHEEGE